MTKSINYKQIHRDEILSRLHSASWSGDMATKSKEHLKKEYRSLRMGLVLSAAALLFLIFSITFESKSHLQINQIDLEDEFHLIDIVPNVRM